MTLTAFWGPLRQTLGRLAQVKALLVPPSRRAERVRHLIRSSPRAERLPQAFIETLVGLDQRLAGVAPADVLALQWNLLQGLWGSAPDGACAAVLEELGLTRATPGFWGMYLDGLIAAGSGRRALVEIRRALAEKPHLVWARIAWTRLPRIWTGLKVHGFGWSEDDGVPALLERLAVRPAPKLSGLLLAE
jgi:hypothetical protein